MIVGPELAFRRVNACMIAMPHTPAISQSAACLHPDDQTFADPLELLSDPPITLLAAIVMHGLVQSAIGQQARNSIAFLSNPILHG